MRMQTSVAIFSLCGVLACKPKAESEPTMTKGTVLDGQHKFRPWFASIRASLSGNAIGRCSGVLVGPRHVLTAAHCFDEAESVSAIFYSENMTPQQVKVAGWKIHPRYLQLRNTKGLGGVASDLAVVVLNEPLVRSFASIESSRMFSIRGGRYVGAGRIEDDVRDGKVRYSQGLDALKKVEPGAGASWLSKGDSIICNGDSGGPFFTSGGRLVGIASSVGVASNSKDYCGAGDVVYHADVYSNIQWIACAYKGWGVPLPGFEKPTCK